MPVVRKISAKEAADDKPSALSVNKQVCRFAERLLRDMGATVQRTNYGRDNDPVGAFAPLTVAIPVEAIHADVLEMLADIPMPDGMLHLNEVPVQSTPIMQKDGSTLSARVGGTSEEYRHERYGERFAVNIPERVMQYQRLLPNTSGYKNARDRVWVTIFQVVQL